MGLLDEFLLTNIFPFELVFEKAIEGIDFFEVKGVFPRTERYRKLGDVVFQLELDENAPFAKYFGSKDEDFVISALSDTPSKKEHTYDGIAVTYAGKRSLEPTEEGKRALLELIYSMQRRKLRQAKYWNLGHDTAFPWEWKNLYDEYGCELNFFRGPCFRFYFLSTGRLILVLDTTTHYIESRSFLDEIRSRGKDLRWLQEEINAEKERCKQGRRRFNGIYFHYIIGRKGVAVDGVDPRPISKIRIEASVEGKPWNGSVYDYMKKRYSWNKRVKVLDPWQPAVCKGSYAYVPQLLHRHVNLRQVPKAVLNENTFLMDPDGAKEDRDPQSPARRRWACLEKELKLNFTSIALGKRVFGIGRPITGSVSTIKEPRLLVQKEGGAVKPHNLLQALRKGPYKAPELEEIFLFSVDDRLVKPFWTVLIEYFESNFGWTPPEKPTMLEKSETEIQTYLEKRKGQNSLGKAACIAILEDGSPMYKTLTNLLSRYSIALQCLRKETAASIVDRHRRGFLEGICAGFFAKAGGIPWLLYDPLVYERYAAVDVGRQEAEWWAMGIVYDKRGFYEILAGEMIIGEDLDIEALKSCTSRALRSSVPDSFLILRDGDVSAKELKAFEDLMSQQGVRNSAMVSIKKQVPHRLFRSAGNEIRKPVSGDFIELDENLIVICLAGVDRYQHGTPIPKVLEVIPISGQVNSKDIARDVFFLSYLNWGSPSHGYSSPAPVKLAHVLASALSHGLKPFGPPF